MKREEAKERRKDMLCSNCAFCVEPDGNQEPPYLADRCHRYPPDKNGEFPSIWNKAEEWCGEWRPA